MGGRTILAEPEARFDGFPAAQEIAAEIGRKRRTHLYIFGFEPLALPWHPPVPKWTEKEEYLERNVETKPDRTDDPESNPEPQRATPPAARA